MNNRLCPISVPTSGLVRYTEIFCPPGQDFQGKHSEPLGMVNPYLVVAANERLSGGNWSSAVHFQVRVVIFSYKNLQDVQHLDRGEKRGDSERSETANATQRKREPEVWIIAKRIRAD